MKEKNARLELRLTAKEKEQLESIAKKCGLPVSEYLRKRGLGYEPGPLLYDRFYEVYSKLCEISNLPLQPETEAVLIADSCFSEFSKIITTGYTQHSVAIDRTRVHIVFPMFLLFFIIAAPPLNGLP